MAASFVFFEAFDDGSTDVPFVWLLTGSDWFPRELLAEPLFGASIVAAGALRGAGDTFVPSLMNLGSIWIVRLGLAMILVKSLGLYGMWIAMAVELCVRGCLMLYRQRTSKYYDLYKKKTATENV